MEPTGRFGGRASEKAGTRDSALAMDSFDGGPGSGPKQGGSMSQARNSWEQHQSEEGRKANLTPKQRTKEDKEGRKQQELYRKMAAVSGIGPYAGKDAQGTSELENEYNEGMDESVKTVSRRTLEQKFRDGDWSAISDERYGHQEIQDTETRKRFTVRIADARDEYRDEAHENAELARGRREDEVQAETGPTNEFREPVGIADVGTGRFGGRGSDKAGGRDLAMDPTEPQSEAQRRAMHAAASGKSTLGIPQHVGEKITKEWGEGH